MTQYWVEILPFGKKQRAAESENLHHLIRGCGIPLASPCGGRGKCGKCHITLIKGSFQESKPSATEKAYIQPEDLARGVRLACQATLNGSVKIHVPPESLARDISLGTTGPETTIRPFPAIKKYYSAMTGPSFHDLKPDTERLVTSLQKQGLRPRHVSPSILALLPDTLRESGWGVTATIQDKHNIIDVETGDCRDDCYGLAIDLGTTKIGGSLVDLITGKRVTVFGDANPQIPYGEDVLSRIHYAAKGDEERKFLQKTVINSINQLILEACRKSNIDTRHIYEATLVGNSAMHHLFLGISTVHLAESPYVPAVKGPLDIRARDLGLNINSEGNIHTLPLITGFVGSDCLAGVLATGMYKEKKMCLLLDIGTNTEVVLGNRDRMVACSCASGPAFEGAHIKHGMKAAKGAIECVGIDKQSNKIYTQTIRDAAPAGLCGSGIIDCVAEMCRSNIIDDQGMFTQESDFASVRRSAEGMWELVIAQNEKSGQDIVVTQQDVNEIQLSKAAVLTGISILMQELHVTPDQIEKVYIAGAFGSTLNPINAKRIGMIPDIPVERIKSTGNTAMTGAQMALISTRSRRKSQRVSKQLEYLELATHPDFQSFFVNSLRFPKK